MYPSGRIPSLNCSAIHPASVRSSLCFNPLYCSICAGLARRTSFPWLRNPSTNQYQLNVDSTAMVSMRSPYRSNALLTEPRSALTLRSITRAPSSSQLVFGISSCGVVAVANGGSKKIPEAAFSTSFSKPSLFRLVVTAAVPSDHGRATQRKSNRLPLTKHGT